MTPALCDISIFGTIWALHQIENIYRGAKIVGSVEDHWLSHNKEWEAKITLAMYWWTWKLSDEALKLQLRRKKYYLFPRRTQSWFFGNLVCTVSTMVLLALNVNFFSFAWSSVELVAKVDKNEIVYSKPLAKMSSCSAENWVNFPLPKTAEVGTKVSTNTSSE